MSRKTVLVTGGAGFVGSNLVRKLLSNDYNVKVFDDLSTGLQSNVSNLENCELKVSSIVDSEAIEAAVRESDHVIHLAARGSVPRSIKNPQATFEVNTLGTFNVVEAARKYTKPLIFSSSSSVYGDNLDLPKIEKTWTAPITPYAASKLSGESLVSSYGKTFHLPFLTFRFFNIFGPYQRPDHDYAAVIPKWIWKAMNDETLEVYGDGTQTRDFTSVDDVTDLILLAMKREIVHPEPINLAFGSRISLNQVIDSLRVYFPKINVEYRDLRVGDVKDSQNNPALIKNTFPNYSPRSFTIQLKKTIEWLEGNHAVITNGPDVKD